MVSIEMYPFLYWLDFVPRVNVKSPLPLIYNIALPGPYSYSWDQQSHLVLRTLEGICLLKFCVPWWSCKWWGNTILIGSNEKASFCQPFITSLGLPLFLLHPSIAAISQSSMYATDFCVFSFGLVWNPVIFKEAMDKYPLIQFKAW